jgi:hypothetical protein
MHAGVVVPSPMDVARFQLIAHLIGFSGPLFIEEYPPVPADAFGADSLPRPARGVRR